MKEHLLIRCIVPLFINHLKGTFEALKANFNQQIDNYNDSLSNKIDGSIANYLEGLKVANKVKTTTGFDLVGKTRKEIRFVGRASSGWNFSNDLYARDKIVFFANGGYSTGPDHFIHDSYDNWVWDGIYTRGNTTNTYFLIDDNRCVKNIYWNVAMYLNRFYAFYSTTNAQDGITWDTIQMTLDHPTALLSNSDAGINTDEALSFAKGRGHSRIEQHSSRATYTEYIGSFVMAVGNASAGSGTMDGYTVYNNAFSNKPKQCVVTPVEVKARRDLQQQLSILMSKNESDYGIHLCYQPTTKIHTSDQKWGEIEMVKKDKDSLQDYTVADRLRFESGYWSFKARALSADSRVVKGYGVKFHEILDETKTDKPPKWTFNDVYYSELNKVWDETERLKYTGGFPVFKAEKDGELEFTIKADKATNIIFTNSQNTTMPVTTATNVREFDYKLTAATNYTTGVKNLNVVANTNYTTTHAQNGVFWNSITQTLNTPTAITDQNSAYINATDAKGYGVRRNTSDAEVYKILLQERNWSDNGSPTGYSYNTSTGEYNYQNLYRTDLETKDLTEVTKTCDVAISGTDVKTNLHWPTGSNNNIHTTDKEWGSKDLITSYNTSRVDYTYTYKLKNAGGQIGTMELARQITPSVKGYGLKWVFSDKALTGVYYDGMYDNWNIKYSYAGGLPICHANKKSLVKISLKCDTTVPMAFTTSQNTTFPTGSDSRFKKFRSKLSTQSTFVERTAPVNFTANVDYDFEIDLNAGEDLFLTTNMTTLSNTLTITQLGDAFITEEG